jgi:3-methylcrotonyl-CoA carboxylase alpha subunit
MGLKDEAKRVAEAAGVPVLAGYRGEDQSEKRLLKAAKDIGFPVLIKAVAGGGGRGIREVASADAFKDALASAQRESKAAFGDDRVLVERLVERPRHIEVQVFADKHGGAVHLYERDCSLQRRRQKVIEEAPAPGMSQETREAMCGAALKIARAVGYDNAGTVEFIVDGAGPPRPDGFWFLEMNTRLQVEHPVTEAVTGIDLVAWQLRVAAGEPLPLRQEEISLSGHAVEARICAEDPSENFRPSAGRITALQFGSEARVDAGFAAGDVVPPDYDSLIAKVIAVSGAGPFATADAARSEAVRRLSEALGEGGVAGLRSNTGFLRRLLALPAFASGAVHTGLISEHMETLTDRTSVLRQAALMASLWTLARERDGDPWAAGDGWRANAPAQRVWRWETAGTTIDVALGEAALATVNGQTMHCRLQAVNGADVRAVLDAATTRARIWAEGETLQTFCAGEWASLALEGVRVDASALEAGDEIRAPLPGKVIAASAVVGQTVAKGDVVAVLEAMKMEHALRSPRDGVIAALDLNIGAFVREGAVLVRLAAEVEAAG